MGEVRVVNFLRMFDKFGDIVRDLTIREGVDPIESAEFMFDRNQGIDFIEFIRAEYEEGQKPTDKNYTILASVRRKDLNLLRESRFSFKKDQPEENVEQPAERSFSDYAPENEPEAEAMETKPLTLNFEPDPAEEAEEAERLDVNQMKKDFLLQVVDHQSFSNLTINELNILGAMMHKAIAKTGGELIGD